MRLARTATAVLAVALGVCVALAQGSGGLNIRVLDSDSQPLPGATVTISHETGNVKPYTTVTDMRGIAAFPVLRPGPGYIVEVSFPGFGARRESGIRVPIGDIESVSIHLSEELQERVRVTATEDVVELEQTQSSTKFNEDFVQDLPVPGRFYQDVLTLAPGVQDPDGDGNPTVHGSRSRDFKAEVGGVSNVDPLTGQFMGRVNADSIEAMEVITGGAGVEFGRAQGGFARIIQKQGTNQFEGTFAMLYRTSKLDGTGALDQNNLPDPEFDEIHPAFQVSGPILKDKLWYRLSHEILDQEDPINVVGGIAVQTQQRGIHADQLTWQVSPRNKLAFQFQADPLVVGNFGIASTTPPEAAQTIETGSTTYSLIWTAPYSPKLLVESTVAWQDLTNDIGPSVPGQNNNCVVGVDFMEQAQCTDFQTQEISGSHFLDITSHSQRLTVRSQATLYGGQFWGANHQFKFGFAIENERFERTMLRRPNIGFFILDPVNDPNSERNPEELPIITANVAVPTESYNTATGTNWGFYFEDQIKPRNNLVITVGARIDREEISSDGMSTFDPELEGQAYLAALDEGTYTPDAVLRNAFTAYEGIGNFVTELSRITGTSEDTLRGAMSPITLQSRFWSHTRSPENVDINNTNLSPFLSVSWDPWSNGKNRFAVSGRRYYDKIFLAIPLTEVNPAISTLVYEGTLNEDERVEVCTTCLRNSVNPAVNINAVDRDLSTPYQDEFRLFYERELFTETLLHVEYINRKYRDQFQNIDLNHVPGDFGRCRVADLQNRSPIMESPGVGEVINAHTGEVYMDTDPGIGDGLLDDCSGKFEIYESDPTNQVPFPDRITDLYIQNPGWNQLLLLGNFNHADYEGLVLEMIRRQYRSWEMQASYTYSKATGNGEDFNQFLGLDQSQIDNEYGYQSNDQRHVFKFIATTITPWGFRLGGTAQWQSGLPYSVFAQALSFDPVPEQYLISNHNPARQRLRYLTAQRNSERNDSQWLFDMKLTKEFNLGRGMNMQVSAEIFNLFNDSTYQIYNPNFETGFQINGVNNARREFGRQFQLGMKLAF